MGDTGSHAAQSPSPGPPRAMYVFDALVALVGAALGAWAVVEVVTAPTAFPPAALLGIPLIAVMARFPVLLGRGPISIEIGFESCVLVFLAVTVPPWTALLVWSAGVLLGELTGDKRARVRAFNTGLGVLSGALALWVVWLVVAAGDGAAEDSPHELLAVGLACAAYFVADWVVTLVSIGLERRRGLRVELVQPGALGALTVFVAVDSLGYLAAMVHRNLPPWSTLLLAVPVAIILFAAWPAPVATSTPAGSGSCSPPRSGQ